MARQKKRKAPVNIPICLAIILLFLTLISVRFSGGIVARYTTTTDSGDSARVIQFSDISLTLRGDTAQYIYPGAKLTWNANVTFEGSESATYVFVDVSGVHFADQDKITPVKNGPSWSVANGWNYLGEFNGAYVYYLALAPNVTLPNDEMPQSFFESDTATVSTDLTDNDLSAIFAGIDSIKATFRASVVQSNGFDSPKTAWESLERKH